MPFSRLTGTLVTNPAPTAGSATVNLAYTKNGATANTNFTMTATPVNGGAPITVTGTFSVPNGNGSGQGTATFTFNPPLNSSVNYNLSVTATQQQSNANFPGTFNVMSATNVDVICFLPGTMIATPSGQVAVETLSRGDLVMTADGRAVPVLWLGQQSVSTVFGMNEATSPVRIAAGALGQGLPLRDLRVTAGHALLLDGVLVNAGALVNGTTITRIGRTELGETFTVFHVETEHHEIILAEGAASETYIDNGSRARFDNHAEFVELFGAEGRTAAELHQPRAMSPRQVPASVAARIAAQAASASAKAA